MDNSPGACANALLEIVPLIMRNIRAKVRRHSGPELSVAQFRALAFLGPSLLHHRNGALGSIVTAAPPLAASPGTAEPDNPLIAPLRRKAGGALDQLRAQRAH